MGLEQQLGGRRSDLYGVCRAGADDVCRIRRLRSLLVWNAVGFSGRRSLHYFRGRNRPGDQRTDGFVGLGIGMEPEHRRAGQRRLCAACLPERPGELCSGQCGRFGHHSQHARRGRRWRHQQLQLQHGRVRRLGRNQLCLAALGGLHGAGQSTGRQRGQGADRLFESDNLCAGREFGLEVCQRFSRYRQRREQLQLGGLLRSAGFFGRCGLRRGDRLGKPEWAEPDQ